MRKLVSKLTLMSLLLFFFIRFVSVSVFADDASVGRTPEGVFPIVDNDVEMESEEIIVDLEKNTVTCVFVFHNTGAAKKIDMGFPGKLDENEGSNFSSDVSLSLSNFKSFINDKEVPVAREKGFQPETVTTEIATQYTEWFTFSVPFQANERLTVKNTYTYEPTYDSIGNVTTGYVLQTGSLWKDNIGSASVIFKLGNIQPYMIEALEPGGFQFDGNDLIWSRKDFEPSYDLRVMYNVYHYSEEFLGGVTGEGIDPFKAKIKEFSIVKELTEKKDMVMLADHYFAAGKNSDYVLALYIKSLLPEGSVPDMSTRLGDIQVQENEYGYLIDCNVQGENSAYVKLLITDKDTGEAIYDGYNSAIIRDFKEGKTYIIAAKLTDWLDQTYEKTMTFTVPEEKQVETTISQTATSEKATIDTLVSNRPSPMPTNEMPEEQKKPTFISEDWAIGLLSIVVAIVFLLLVGKKRKNKLN